MVTQGWSLIKYFFLSDSPSTTFNHLQVIVCVFLLKPLYFWLFNCVVSFVFVAVIGFKWDGVTLLLVISICVVSDWSTASGLQYHRSDVVRFDWLLVMWVFWWTVSPLGGYQLCILIGRASRSRLIVTCVLGCHDAATGVVRHRWLCWVLVIYRSLPWWLPLLEEPEIDEKLKI